MAQRILGLISVAVLSAAIAGCGGETPDDVNETPDSGADGDSDGDADGDSDGDTDGDSDGDSDADAGCDQSTFGITGVDVDMLIVLDRSNSMCDQGLWSEMTEALVALTDTMEIQVNFGLMVFPSLLCEGTANQCSATSGSLVPIGEESASDIAEQISGTEDIGCCGGTPTALALAGAADYLATVPDDLRKFVLLATDGAPACNPDIVYPDDCTCVGEDSTCEETVLNCLDDDEAIATAGDLEEAGYSVYVLGVGDSLDWQEVMDGIAEAGGTGSYTPAEDAAALEAALQAIVGEVITCEFDIDWSTIDESADPEQVNFYGDGGGLIPFDEGCGANEGWDWIDDDTVVLCEAACGQLQSGAWSSVTAVFGCDTIPVD